MGSTKCPSEADRSETPCRFVVSSNIKESGGSDLLTSVPSEPVNAEFIRGNKCFQRGLSWPDWCRKLKKDKTFDFSISN